MRKIISDKIDDCIDFDFPEVFPREINFPFYDKLADVAIGMRRSGKTCACYQKIRELLSQKIPQDRILYFNFEDEKLFGFTVEHFDIILQEYFKRYPANKNEKCYFFLDEIQNVKGWELFVRRIMDTENVKLCITGSSSRQLSKEIASSLRGRGLTTEIFPLNFREYLKFNDANIDFKKTYSTKKTSILQHSFDNYFNIGGFPEIQKMQQPYIGSLLQSYTDIVIFRDIIERHGVVNVQALKHLVHDIVSRPATTISIRKIYNTFTSEGIKCSKDGLYSYVDYLNDCYFSFCVRIYSSSYRKKMVNPYKNYVIDLGLIRASVDFNKSDNGRLLENLVYINLRRKFEKIEYYLTQDGHEVDFVVTEKDNKISLYQVCWDCSEPDTFGRETRALKEAMKEFGIKDGTIISYNDESYFKDENIHIIPAWKWLYEY